MQSWMELDKKVGSIAFFYIKREISQKFFELLRDLKNSSIFNLSQFNSSNF
jgi:hypothetical protein